MIKDILFPKQWGEYFLFTRTIIGLDITSEAIHVTKVVAKGDKRTVTLSFSQNIEDGVIKTLPERTVQALKSAFLRVGSYDEVVSNITSSGIIFKELELPFVDREKIAQVITFELEPLLPFSVSNAVIDFIVTKTNKTSKQPSSTVLAAAVPYQLVEKHLALLAQAGISPSVVTIDVFAVAGLLQLFGYTAQKQKLVVIAIEQTTTTLSFFDAQQLRLVRTLSYGANTFLERMNKKNDLSFTLSSVFAHQKNIHALFTSRSVDVTTLAEEVATNMDLPYDIWKYSPGKIITTKRSVSVAPEHIASLACALPCRQTEFFTLRQKEFRPKQYRLFFYQYIFASILLFATLGILMWHYRTQVNKLQSEITSSEQEVITLLQEKFTIPEDEYTTFDEVIEFAEEEATKNRETWLAFSSHARSSFLQYLLELVSIIDKKALGFEVGRISIEQDRLILQAKVRDYEALKILERELRQSPLFSYIEPQDNPDFTMSITLAPLGEDV